MPGNLSILIRDREAPVTDPIPPETWVSLELRQALAARDMPTVYRILNATGVSQRRIASLTGQQSSEISEIAPTG